MLSAMGEWTAIVLAGQRPGEDSFAASHGVSAKALIPVGGEPMLGRVVRALLASPSIGRILVLAQEAEALLAGELAWLAAEPRVTTANAGAGISLSVEAVAGTAAAPYPILITTADHALLQPEMIEAFVEQAGDADVTFAVVERRVVESAYPDTRRTWVKFKDGHYSGANIFSMRSEKARPATTFWAAVERDRKRALRLLAFLGPTILLGAVTRTMSLAGAARRAGEKIGVEIKPVILPFPNAAIDVDKEADFLLAEKILAPH
jgi:GTP:adenosylcobinamide-phosphate guanylyltransferase